MLDGGEGEIEGVFVCSGLLLAAETASFADVMRSVSVLLLGVDWLLGIGIDGKRRRTHDRSLARDSVVRC